MGHNIISLDSLLGASELLLALREALVHCWPEPNRTIDLARLRWPQVGRDHKEDISEFLKPAEVVVEMRMITERSCSMEDLHQSCSAISTPTSAIIAVEVTAHDHSARALDCDPGDVHAGQESGHLVHDVDANVGPKVENVCIGVIPGLVLWTTETYVEVTPVVVS